MKLLCISNGHGEDVIALRILSALQKYRPTIQISALPITGTGSAYSAKGIPIISRSKALPSGGFLNRDIRQLGRDLRKGLLPLTQQQLRAIKAWTTEADNQPEKNKCVLAVGDIVPLLFARLSQLPYHFVGTAKSEYWLRDERGKLPPTSLARRLEGWSGSVYLPWERWLMSGDRCRSIFVRDALTAQQLQKIGIPATYAGNPMMDNLAPTGQLDPLLGHIHKRSQTETSPALASQTDLSEKAIALYVTPKQQTAQPLSIALIPGSRQPEAYENWTRILTTLPSLARSFPNRPLILLGAIAPSLSLEKLQAPLATDWKPTQISDQISTQYPTYTHQNITLVLINNAYSDCLHEAEIAIATAGTATEQFVGLGKPAITLPGPGPQFTSAFATVQAKMLGPSIQMLKDSSQTGETIKKIIADPDRLQLIYQNGTHRMGQPGAADRIAKQLLESMNEKQ